MAKAFYDENLYNKKDVARQLYLLAKEENRKYTVDECQDLSRLCIKAIKILIEDRGLMLSGLGVWKHRFYPETKLSGNIITNETTSVPKTKIKYSEPRRWRNYLITIIIV